MARRAVLLVGLVLVLAACGATSHVSTSHRVTHPKFVTKTTPNKDVVEIEGRTRQLFFFTPKPNWVSCELDLNMTQTSSPTAAWCENQSRGVNLFPSGRVRVTCSGCIGNVETVPTLSYGSSVSLGPFRCTALHAGALCVIKKTGRGFLLGGGRGVPQQIRGG